MDQNEFAPKSLADCRANIKRAWTFSTDETLVIYYEVEGCDKPRNRTIQGEAEVADFLKERGLIDGSETIGVHTTMHIVHGEEDKKVRVPIRGLQITRQQAMDFAAEWELERCFEETGLKSMLPAILHKVVKMFSSNSKQIA